MHQAQHVLDTLLRPMYPGVSVSAWSLPAGHLSSLTGALELDSSSYFYSGAVSIGDAAQAIDRQLFTWATVKLYYAAFYLLRSILAHRGVCLFYDGTKPYSLRCLAGQSPTKRDGPTHKVVLRLFESEVNQSVLLTQPIGAENPLNWLMARREAANYSTARFEEPAPPSHFRTIAQLGVRRALSAYVKDDSYLYTFDPDHAMFAFPVEILKQAWGHLKSHGRAGPTEDDLRYLAGLFLDRKGPLADMTALLRR
jgi:hypothetical protein